MYYQDRKMLPKKNSDSKTVISKREIKARLENRRKKNLLSPHPVVTFLADQEKSFLETIEPLGYPKEHVYSIVDKGLRALEFNLLAELVAQREKEIAQQEDNPIALEALMTMDDKLKRGSEGPLITHASDNRGSEVNIEKLRPQVVKLYTKDKVPEKKFSEWYEFYY